MRNLLVTICYKGTAYHGYQVQKNAVTVAEKVQDAVERVLGRREDIVGCSRTDTGVHANMYCFHMKTEHSIPCERLPGALNTFLPFDIAVLSCREVRPAFHARYHSLGKEYVYKIFNSRIRSPFWEGLAYQYPYALDAETLDRCARRFLGTHDFRAFCAAGGDLHDTVRTITESRVAREGDLVTYTVRGDGFLYKMVRIMTGTLLLAAAGRLDAADISEILATGDRSRACRTAPAHGLYLNRVFYNEADF